MGQLHTYVNWYRENVMTEHDQPPIGSCSVPARARHWSSTEDDLPSNEIQLAESILKTLCDEKR